METTEFNNLLEKLNKIENDILINKGQEYRRGDADVLANFKRIAQMLDLPVEKVWAVYFTKHFDAIINYVLTGKIFSDEKIDERVYDARNYLALGLAIFQEGRGNKVRQQAIVKNVLNNALGNMVLDSGVPWQE